MTARTPVSHSRVSRLANFASGLVIVVALLSAASGQISDAAATTQAKGTAEVTETAQTKTATAPDPRRDIEDFLQARAAMFQEMNAAREGARGGSAAKVQAVEDWFRRNAARVEAVQQQAARISRAQVPPNLPPIREVTIPAGASPDLEEFLVERARMSNDLAAIQSRAVRSPEGDAKAMEEWSRKNGARLEAQNQRAATISAQSVPHPLPVPAEPMIPRGASPELAAFLTERHTLFRELSELEARTARLGKPDRDEALARWVKESALRFESLASKAAALSEK